MIGVARLEGARTAYHWKMLGNERDEEEEADAVDSSSILPDSDEALENDDMSPFCQDKCP